MVVSKPIRITSNGYVTGGEPAWQMIKRIFRLNLPWLGWPTELTCGIGTSEKHYVHLRVGTVWCWLFIGLGLLGLKRLFS